MSASNESDYPEGDLICLDSKLSSRSDVEVIRSARNSLEAVRLVQLGARAPLVSRLTGLDKKVVNRLYRQLTGRHSPPGQMPFSDRWYLQNNQRLQHVNVVWRLYQQFMQWQRSEARQLIDVYETYLNYVRTPVLSLTRTFFVPHLVTVQEWCEQVCDDCATAYIAPLSSHRSICPVCSQYFNYRCRGCGAILQSHPQGRRCTICSEGHRKHDVNKQLSGTANGCAGC